MRIRGSHWGGFFGCSQFPNCSFVVPGGRQRKPDYRLSFIVAEYPNTEALGIHIDVSPSPPLALSLTVRAVLSSIVSSEEVTVFAANTVMLPLRSGIFDTLSQIADALVDIYGERGLDLYVRYPPRKAVETLLAHTTGVATVTRWGHKSPAHESLHASLRPFQREGVEFVLSRNRRAMIADEMGTGKTVQALASLVAGENGFPALIVAPASARGVWAEEIERWLPDFVDPRRVHVVYDSDSWAPKHFVNDGGRYTVDILITSYHMLASLVDAFKLVQWRVMICDESHYLLATRTGTDAKYTEAVASLSQVIPDVLLLSGTPSLTAPFDAFRQFDILRPGLFGNDRWDFAADYCDVRLEPHLVVGDCLYTEELRLILKREILIRREKKEVLAELPVKTRRLVYVPTSRSENGEAISPSFQSAYRLAGVQKLPGVLEFVSSAIESISGVKLVLFAHHIAFQDELCKFLSTAEVSFLRLDGSVVGQQRSQLIRQFQENDSIRCFVVGITACIGLSFTAASLAVFCELPPNAAWLQQAEDRLHRPGQESAVETWYLMGRDSSFDADHWSRLAMNYATIRAMYDSPEPQMPSHSSRDTEIVNSSEPRTKLAKVLESQKSLENLKFGISSHTGRVHLFDGNTYLGVSFLPHEIYELAFDCHNGGKHQPQDLLVQEIIDYWDSISGSNVARRKALLTCGPGEVQSIRTSMLSYCRFTPSWDVGATPDPGCVFFTWRVQRAGKSASDYRGQLHVATEAVFCLNCGDTVALPSSIAGSVQAGAVVVVPNDYILFCCGDCRAAFYVKRSSGAIRKQLRRLDNMKCAACGLDCGRLLEELRATEDVGTREAVALKNHPQLASHRNLLQRLCTDPVEGNAWHGDHVMPVSRGGGESALTNLQTLCTFCHSQKTAQEQRIRLDDGRKEGPSTRTTFHLVLAALRSEGPRRTTRHKVVFRE